MTEQELGELEQMVASGTWGGRSVTNVWDMFAYMVAEVRRCRTDLDNANATIERLEHSLAELEGNLTP